jgi:cytochrome c oxidase subunit 2
MKKLALLYLVLFAITACNETSPKKLDNDKIMKDGPILFAKYGCAICHSLDGKIIYGPSLNNIYMKEIKVIRNGKELTVIADREYLKRAITDPRAEKVLDYQNKEMPVPSFSKEEADILVEYLILLN